MNYLLDTDILIDWLRGKSTAVNFFLQDSMYLLLFINYSKRTPVSL